MLSDPAVAALRKAADEKFVFFPPLRGIGENRWRFSEATRIEFSAVNAATREVVWFPRSNVSYVTVEDSGLTIALKREMRYSGGAVWTVPDAGQAGEPEEATTAEARRLRGQRSEEADGQEVEPAGAATVWHPPARRRCKGLFSEPLALVLSAAVVVTLVLVISMVVARDWLRPPSRADASPISDTKLWTLTGEDNYESIVRKIGAPERVKSLSAAGNQLQQHALIYLHRNYAVILLGLEEGAGSSQEPRYIGALSLTNGAVVAAVSTSHNTDTASFLRLVAPQVKGEK